MGGLGIGFLSTGIEVVDYGYLVGRFVVLRLGGSIQLWCFKDMREVVSCCIWYGMYDTIHFRGAFLVRGRGDKGRISRKEKKRKREGN